MKKIVILFLVFNLSFGKILCCPQSCDRDVASAFKELKKEIKKAFEENIEKLNAIRDGYAELIKEETNSTLLLNRYLQRLKIEYLKEKKAEFYIKKDLNLKVYSK